ncbi:MAG: hypothetical protein BMS9Abin34_471 [Patescibacteria group bacterium]|nr:MAG: hypothetical protein BMS9Abin34_471 [Patescibacteria group bacterium]
MRENVARYAEKFINLEIIGLAFLLPLFFLPVTTEFFEFNKLILLAVAVFLGFLAWGIKVVASGRWGFRPSPFDAPILALWVVTLISTILSDSRLVSVLGQYARWYPSLVSVTIFTLFFFLVSWNLKRETLRRVGYALGASGFAAIILFWPQYFGVNIFGQSWSAGATFTPLGSPTTLALFLGAVSGLVLKEMLRTQKPVRKNLLAGLLALFAATLVLINNPAGWVALAAAVIIALVGSGVELWSRSKWPLLAVFLTSLVFAGVVLVPPLFDKTTFLNSTNFPKGVTLDLKTSWSVSATSFRQKPLWGSGPSTFLIDFTRYKPLRFNQTPFWTLRFEKPLNEYLRSFAEEGLLGVLAWLFLIGVFVKTSLRRGSGSLAVLGGAVLTAFFFTTSTIVPGFLLLTGLAATRSDSQTSPPSEAGSPSAGKSKIALLTVIALLTILGFNWIYRAYAAEALHRRSLTRQDGQEAYNLQVKAVQKFPWRAAYRLSLSQTSFILANNLARKEEPSQEDQENIKILVSQAISEARRATDLYPLNAGNWEGLSQIYRSLIGLAKDAETWATDSYQRAISLDLFNPLLRISFGGLYYQLGEYEQAVNQFRAATNLKPNFANAHYNLGRAYKELGSNDLAIQELELALRLTNPEAEGYKEAQQILEELKQQK